MIETTRRVTLSTAFGRAVYELHKIDKSMEVTAKAIKRLSEKIRRPKRWPRSRAVLSVPCFSVYLRKRFRPYYRCLRQDGSLLEFGMLGLVVLINLPKWSVSR